MNFRKPQLGVHANRGKGTCYSGQHFIYSIRTSCCCLLEAYVDLTTEIGSHPWQYRCSYFCPYFSS